MPTFVNAILDFVAVNAAIFVSLVALVISFRANTVARYSNAISIKSKADADRVLLFEKKREILNELDRQHARMGTLLMITAQKIILFNEHPNLREKSYDEYERLKNNLDAVQCLRSSYDHQREGVEKIDVGAEISAQDELLANIRRLTIHIEESILKEENSLDEIRAQVSLFRSS